MPTRSSFPGRQDKRRQGALARRMKDMETHAKTAHDNKDLTGELAKLKLERAKSDVNALKVKLGLK